MNISEVRVKLVQNQGERLKAFCTITFENAFVVRDVKIIGGPRGTFVAMPSRKATDRCPSCGFKNQLKAKYCNECGSRQAGDRGRSEGQQTTRLHVDVAHPINQECRSSIERAVLDAYDREVERSQQPGYAPPDLHDEDVEFDPPASRRRPPPRDNGLARRSDRPPHGDRTDEGDRADRENRGEREAGA